MEALVPLVPGTIAGHPMCVLGRVGQAAFRISEQKLLGLGLRVRHYSILQTLEDAGASSQLDLGNALRIDAATMVASIDDLESMGLATRRRDPADRRRYLVEVTDKGRTTLVAANAMLDALDDEALSGLSATQREQLTSILDALTISAPLVATFDQLRTGSD